MDIEKFRELYFEQSLSSLPPFRTRTLLPFTDPGSRHNPARAAYDQWLQHQADKARLVSKAGLYILHDYWYFSQCLKMLIFSPVVFNNYPICSHVCPDFLIFFCFSFNFLFFSSFHHCSLFLLFSPNYSPLFTSTFSKRIRLFPCIFMLIFPLTRFCQLVRIYTAVLRT